VRDGPLTGKVKLHLVVFPLRSNPHSKEAGLAFLAARELGAQWAFVRLSYAHFDRFDLDTQAAWAETVGLDAAEFTAALADPALAEALVAGKRAGLDAGVEGTPTFFIDGRRYVGEMEVEELVDVLEEVHERGEGG